LLKPAKNGKNGYLLISVKIDKIQAGLVVFMAGNASIWGAALKIGGYG
jgi:hypothetical protein